MTTSERADAPIAHRWMRRFYAVPERPACRLLVFPHAGGSASYYFPFVRALAAGVDVIAVQYPGRQERHQEPPVGDIQELASLVTAALADGGLHDLPLALFGHSMGALVAYETAHRLADLGVQVRRLLVSGCRGPSVRNDHPPVHTRDDDGLVAVLRAMGGTDDELLADPAFRRLTLPALRADYRAVETYRYRRRPKLTMPVTALIGDSDPRVSVTVAREWAASTTGAFALRVFPGGHFYLSDPGQQAAVIALLRDELTGAPPAPPASDHPPGRRRADSRTPYEVNPT
jgi:pyochelin biosynthetic protein PchC